MKKQIAKIDKQIELLKAKRQTLIDRGQAKCKHLATDTIEVSYEQEYDLSCRPPFRVCKACGLAEEGWGCGYKKLTEKEVPSCSRDYAMKYVLKFVKQRNMQ